MADSVDFFRAKVVDVFDASGERVDEVLERAAQWIEMTLPLLELATTVKEEQYGGALLRAIRAMLAGNQTEVDQLLKELERLEP